MRVPRLALVTLLAVLAHGRSLTYWFTSTDTIALIDTYRWYVEEFEADADATGEHHRVARDQGALALARRVFQAF